MIEPSMKRDGRTFDHQTLEAIRMMAVERVREGEHPADVIASYGFNRTTIYRWLNAADDGGEQALRSTKATGRPPSLMPEQEQQFSAGSMARTRGSTVSTSACGRARSWRN